MTWMLVVLALATWRIAHMLVKEDGPLDIFYKLHVAVGIVYKEDGEVDEERSSKSFLSTVLQCVYCTSVWVGLFFTLLGAISIHLAYWVALPFCFSAAAVLLEMWSEK